MSYFTGKSVVITGGASGIGRTAALAFATSGAFVTIGDVDQRGASETIALIKEQAGEGVALSCDVTANADLKNLIATAENHFGAVDVVVGNAGLLRTASIEDLSQELFEQHLAINLTANLMLTKAALPALRRRGGGSIVFNASLGGLRGTRGSAAYNASKGGLINLTRSLADELAPLGIRVNCVCPGWIDTPFNQPFWEHAGPAAVDQLVSRIPLRRQGSADEVARAMLFLASDDSSYITGQALVIDGGLSST